MKAPHRLSDDQRVAYLFRHFIPLIALATFAIFCSNREKVSERSLHRQRRTRYGSGSPDGYQRVCAGLGKMPGSLQPAVKPDFKAAARRVNGKLDLPDVYRIGFDLGRKGGVPGIQT